MPAKYGIDAMTGAIKRTQNELSQADYERLAEFRYLIRRFLIFSEKAAEQAGVSAQQHQALLAIKGFGGGRSVNTGALAERLGLHHHSVVGLVDRLESRALIERRRSPDDRRQVLLDLTPKAERLLARLSAAHRNELKGLAPILQALLRHFEDGTL